MTKKKLPANSPLKSKRSYTLRDLPLIQQRNVRKYLLELQDKADDLEALKKPGEMWYFTLFGNRSRLYDTLDLAVPHLVEWAQSAQQRSHGANSPDDVIHGIKLVKFAGKGVNVNQELSDTDFEKTATEFSNIRRRVREQVRKEKIETREKAIEMLAPKKKKGVSRSTTTTALLQSAMDKLEAAAKQMATMQKKLDAMAKKATPKKQKPTKKESKKNVSIGKRATGKTKNTKRATGKSTKQSSNSKPKRKAKSKRKAGR